jgi:hypothetical protein
MDVLSENVKLLFELIFDFGVGFSREVGEQKERNLGLAISLSDETAQCIVDPTHNVLFDPAQE